MTTTAEQIFIDAGLPVLMAVHGHAGTHTAADGTATAVTVMLAGMALDEETAGPGRSVEITCRATIGRDPAAGGVAEITLADTITAGGRTWAVQRILRQDGASTQVMLAGRRAAEVSRPGYRGR